MRRHILFFASLRTIIYISFTYHIHIGTRYVYDIYIYTYLTHIRYLIFCINTTHIGYISDTYLLPDILVFDQCIILVNRLINIYVIKYDIYITYQKFLLILFKKHYKILPKKPPLIVKYPSFYTRHSQDLLHHE